MRIKVSVLAAVSGLSLAALSAPAFAGGCGYGASGNDCGAQVQHIPSAPAAFGPMTVRDVHPMGYLRSVNFQRSPNISITRVHGMGPTAGLSDAPSGFTNGCHPTSTQYCRSDAGTPVQVQLNPAPIVAAPYSAPVYQAPVQQLRTWTGGGYDPSKFAPRQYGENTFTPGIAHIPTSIVDRSPENADRALNSGRAVPQALANGGYAPRYDAQPGYSANRVVLPGTFNRSVTLPGTFNQSVTLPGTFSQGLSYSAPTPAFGGVGGQATAPVAVGDGSFASNVGADGTYWEKTSGPTFFGDTLATTVICKRKLPTQTVNPVVPVPYGVPTPVPTCGPTVHNHSRYGHHGSRWVK